MIKSKNMDSCIFCKIVKGEIPSFKVFEDESSLAFLTNQPIKEGHTLAILKKHTDYIFDLSDEDLCSLMKASKKVAQKLRKNLNPKTGKVGVMIAGLQVHHAHIHLIPMDSERELDFSLAQSTYPQELKMTLEKITQLDK